MVFTFFRSTCITLAFIVLWACSAAGASAAEDSGGDLIIVNKKTNELAFFRDGLLSKKFRVATGKTRSLTPEGTFKIANKIKNRPYYKEHIPGGDPRNPLGDRWLGLEVNGTKGTTYGIHGNNNPYSIGKYVSKGCIRMYDDEIHWLYDQMKVGTTVIITNSKQSFEDIAQKHHYPLMKTIQGNMNVNGENVLFGKDLIMYRDKIYIPVRNLIELLGGEVLWDQKNDKVMATIGDRQIVHVPGTKKITVDGVPLTMSVESRVLNDTVMIPLRDVAQLSGYYVLWDGATSSVILQSL